MQFTLILVLILFLGINTISANEINDNDLNGINSADVIGMDSVENTDVISTDLTEDQNEEISQSDVLSDVNADSADEIEENANVNPAEEEEEDDINPTSEVTKEKTSISVSKTSILRGTTLYIYLKDSNGNPISNKNLSLDIGGNKYTKVTDKNGAVTLTFNLFLGKYTLNVNFNEDSDYLSCSDSFAINIYQSETAITVASTSVARGKYLYAYLKDSSGKAISGQTIKIMFNGETYTRVTDSNGRVYLKIGSVASKYTTKITYAGNTSYKSSSKSFTLTVYKTKTNITVASKSVIRGKYLYAYLKDSSGKAISGQTVKIKFRGKIYTKFTNSNGRVSLKITSVASKYTTKITYAGNTSYKSSSKSFTLTVYKTKTNITVASKSVIRGKYLYAYLKDSKGNPLASKSVKIKFYYSKYRYKYFYKTTNSNGRVSLKINNKPGYYTTKIIYSGSGYYKPYTKSFQLKSYVASTKFTVANSSVVRGKYFYAYLKDSSNKAIKNQKVVITFNGVKYSKTTDSNGRVYLKINSAVKSYAVKLNYAGSISYHACSKSLTVKVLTNATAKITVKSSTSGEYTIKLTDMNGNPLVNQAVNIVTYRGNQSAGSGEKVTKKTIILNTDSIWSSSPYTKEYKFLNDIASILRSKGYNVIVSDVGPNSHCTDVMIYEDACIFCIFSGVCAGTLDDMASNWYQYYLNKNDLQIKIGVYNTSKINLATEDYLPRAHDDDFSNLDGLANPGTFINNQGWDYVYGASATEMANNFLKYAVNGLSIGKDNTLPCITNKYTVTTNEYGLATISGLAPGSYMITTSYSNTALGYVADSVTTTLTV